MGGGFLVCPSLCFSCISPLPTPVLSVESTVPAQEFGHSKSPTLGVDHWLVLDINAMPILGVNTLRLISG